MLTYLRQLKPLSKEDKQMVSRITTHDIPETDETLKDVLEAIAFAETLAMITMLEHMVKEAKILRIIGELRTLGPVGNDMADELATHRMIANLYS